MMGLKAAMSQSGKWHLLGPRGCLSVSAERIKAESVSTVATSGTRDWCSYCERELRIAELEQRVERHEAIIEATDPTVFVAPVRTRKDKIWHATSECSHAARDPAERSLIEALAEGLSACKYCVLEVDQPSTHDCSHYQALVEAGESGSA